MIDFKNATFVKLSPAGAGAVPADVNAMLVDGEQVVQAFKAVRDMVIFTNKRIFAINVQGITGKKKDFTSLPYSKIQAFSVETAGLLDLDSELDLYYSGVGKVRFEFRGASDILNIGRIISQYALR